MSRVLFAWEMGSNFGHLARDLPLALACRDAGHDVLFAVTDLSICGKIAAEYGLAFVRAPAPRARHQRHSSRAAINFADMLLQNGFSDRSFLEESVLGWKSLFDSFKPDVMVYDYAPRALLAARLCSLPVLLLGNGFETPPNVSPLPSFRPWEKIPDSDLLHVEASLVEQINAVLATHGGSRIDRLWDLYADSPLLIAYFPECDHFGPRAEAEYVGMASRLPSTRKVEWKAAGPQVVVYLRSTIPQVENLFAALQQVEADIVCVVPDMPAAWIGRYTRLRFYTEPIDLQALLPRASLAITHGSGTFADAIAAGVPVLMVPSVIEQYLAGVALERQGLGLILRKRDSVPHCLAMVHRMLGQERYGLAARKLAARYADFGQEQSVRRQFEAVQRLIQPD